MYNLKLDMIVRMWQFQDGKCWFCFGSLDLWCDHGGACPESVHIDHDHDTALVRGLLCGQCNRSNGFLDSLSTLQRAVEYHRNPPAVQCLGEISINIGMPRLTHRVVLSERYARMRSGDYT